MMEKCGSSDDTSLIDVDHHATQKRALTVHASQTKHTWPMEKVITMKGLDQIWKMKLMVQIPSGEQTVTSATIFFNQPSAKLKLTEKKMLTKCYNLGASRKLG